eukprot:3213212-Prymnesium_polylepis.1
MVWYCAQAWLAVVRRRGCGLWASHGAWGRRVRGEMWRELDSGPVGGALSGWSLVCVVLARTRVSCWPTR